MTHTQRVLALLSDGKPHSYREGYRLGVMLHSRVADLRKRGYVIECDKSGGDFVYRLLNNGPGAGMQPKGPTGRLTTSLGSSRLVVDESPSSAGVADGAGEAVGLIPASGSSSGTAPADSFSPSAIVATPQTYAEPPALRPPSPELAAGQLTLDAA